MNKLLLLGDEAIAQAAIDAGLSGVFAYPGTPSTEITEYIQDSKQARELGIRRKNCYGSRNRYVIRREKSNVLLQTRWNECCC